MGSLGEDGTTTVEGGGSIADSMGEGAGAAQRDTGTPLGFGAFFMPTRRSTLVSGAGPLACVDGEPSITHLCADTSEARGVAIVAGCTALLLDLANFDAKDDESMWTPLPSLTCHGPPPRKFCGAGSGATLTSILSMDTAARKPLLATLGADATLRLWNYATRACLLTKTFIEPPRCVALHPAGNHILIGGEDKLRLSVITSEDLLQMRTYLVKGVTAAAFSRGGALWASTSGTMVQVYSFLTGKCLLSLRGHTSPVTALHWAYNDATLTSAGLDGAIIEWDVREGKRAREFMLKGAHFSSIACSREGTTVYAVGDRAVTVSLGESSGGGGGKGEAASTGRSTASAATSAPAPAPTPAHSLARVTVHVNFLKKIDMESGSVTQEWMLPENCPHGPLLQLPATPTTAPMLLLGETPLQHLPTTTASLPIPTMQPLGLAGVGPANLACAAAAYWAAAALPFGGSVRTLNLPLPAPEHKLATALRGALSATALAMEGRWRERALCNTLGSASAAVEDAVAPEAGGSRSSSPAPSGEAASASASATSAALLPPAPSFEGKVTPSSLLRLQCVPQPGALVAAASAGVQRMCLSHDMSTLIVGGRDGSILLFDVRDGEGRPPTVEGSLRLPWADDVQVSAEFLDHKRFVLQELREAVAFAYKVHVSSDQTRRDGAWKRRVLCVCSSGIGE